MKTILTCAVLALLSGPLSAAAPAGTARSQANAQAPSANNASGAENGMPAEIVIKGEDKGAKIGSRKPMLDLKADPFETIRPTLEPDQSLLMAQSPLTTGWKNTHPDILFSDRVIEPWRGIFSDRSGILFNLRQQLQDVLQRPITDSEAKHYQWTLTIADEEGRVFQEYEGSKKPPQELFWNGQNSRRQWVQPGRAYSPVYKFVDSGGSPYTRVGKPIVFTGIAHQDSSGLVIGLDSSALFGQDKSGVQFVAKTGDSLIRDAADFIKRRFSGSGVAIRVYAQTKDLAATQGAAVQTYLAKQLMLAPQSLTVTPDVAVFPEQRVEIVLLSR